MGLIFLGGIAALAGLLALSLGARHHRRAAGTANGMRAFLSTPIGLLSFWTCLIGTALCATGLATALLF